jgi:hypothetical protein
MRVAHVKELVLLVSTNHSVGTLVSLNLLAHPLGMRFQHFGGASSCSTCSVATVGSGVVGWSSSSAEGI